MDLKCHHPRTLPHTQVYFPRACILAIYGDQPAATKCSLTGSACLVCFAQKRNMSQPPADGTTQKRTAANMQRRKRVLLAMSNTGQRGANDRAVKRAKRVGVDLEVECGWIGEPAHEWVFGPCPLKDNMYQCLPQVNLHGMDEELVLKLNFGALELFIAECLSSHRMQGTDVRP